VAPNANRLSLRGYYEGPARALEFESEHSLKRFQGFLLERSIKTSEPSYTNEAVEYDAKYLLPSAFHLDSYRGQSGRVRRDHGFWIGYDTQLEVSTRAQNRYAVPYPSERR
jgi:hypothetical protein